MRAWTGVRTSTPCSHVGRCCHCGQCSSCLARWYLRITWPRNGLPAAGRVHAQLNYSENLLLHSLPYCIQHNIVQVLVHAIPLMIPCASEQHVVPVSPDHEPPQNDNAFFRTKHPADDIIPPDVGINALVSRAAL